jgi:glucose/arabinose dehydrogenase
MLRRALHLIAAGALVLAAAGCTAAAEPVATRSASPAGTPAAPASATPAPSPAAPFAVGSVTVVATGLTTPWSIVFTEGSALISERDTGRIVEVTADGGVRDAGRVAGVRHGGEGGLLGLAVDSSRRLYVYSTGASGNRIQRMPLTGAPGSFTVGDAVTLLDGIPAARTHNGGRLAVGPDGFLYATTGDAGDRPAAQDPASLAGKILRLTLDGGIPADNPFPGSPVYSSGHRNPQGLAWAADGTMYAAEFGQDTWDELNVIRAGGNYGWPEVEGAAGREGFLDPVQQWAPSDASPSGMTRWEGDLLIANLRGERLRAVPVADPASAVEYLAGQYGRLRDVAAAPDGSVWILSGNTDGRGATRAGDDRVLRVTPGS